MKYQSLLALFTFCLAIGIAEPSHSLDNKKNEFFSTQYLSVNHKLTAFDQFGVGGDLSYF